MHQPEMLEVCREAMAAASIDMDFVRPDPELFASCPSDSIDYAVMEKTIVEPYRSTAAGAISARGLRCGTAPDVDGNVSWETC